MTSDACRKEGACGKSRENMRKMGTNCGVITRSRYTQYRHYTEVYIFKAKEIKLFERGKGEECLQGMFYNRDYSSSACFLQRERHCF